MRLKEAKKREITLHNQTEKNRRRKLQMNPMCNIKHRFNFLMMIGLGLLAMFLAMPAAVGHT
jgi:hypothetical protein